MAKTFEDRLCTILVKNKLISQSMASELQKSFHGMSKETFDMFLLSEGIVSCKDLLQALSEYYEVPSYDVSGGFFKRNLLMEFPQDVLLRYSIIPLKRDEDFLIIVASRPDNEDLLPELAEYVSDDIQFYVGINNHIVDAVIEFYAQSPFSEGDELNSDDDDLYENEGVSEDIFEDDDPEEDEDIILS